MFRIEKLQKSIRVADFDCGVEALNRFLHLHALASQSANATQTFIGLAGDAVAGFYTLTVGEIKHESAPSRLKKGLAAFPVPVMVLARLAVDSRYQRMGVGAGLLKDAMSRTLQAAEIAGIRAIVVHPKDDAAFRFYVRFNFQPGFDNPLHLYMLTKDARALV